MRLVKPQHILSKRRAVVVVEVSVMLRSTFINHGYGKQKYVQGTDRRQRQLPRLKLELKLAKKCARREEEGRGGGVRERMLTQVVRHE